METKGGGKKDNVLTLAWICVLDGTKVFCKIEMETHFFTFVTSKGLFDYSQVMCMVFFSLYFIFEVMVAHAVVYA